MRSFNGRAEQEVNWRNKHKNAIMTVARFAGIDPLIVGSTLSKKINGGRKQVFERGELVGYS